MRYELLGLIAASEYPLRFLLSYGVLAGGVFLPVVCGFDALLGHVASSWF